MTIVRSKACPQTTKHNCAMGLLAWYAGQGVVDSPCLYPWVWPTLVSTKTKSSVADCAVLDDSIHNAQRVIHPNQEVVQGSDFLRNAHGDRALDNSSQGLSSYAKTKENTSFSDLASAFVLPPLDPQQDKAKALQALKQVVHSFTGCPLAASAEHAVFGEGDMNSPVMLVGEAPGAEEDRQGRPFVGPSGQLLDAMLASIGLDRQAVYITNMVPWRPPFNRQPSTQELALCLPVVRRHIRLVAPKILVCVGGVSTKTLLDTSASMSALQGLSLNYTDQEGVSMPAFALYHPAYLLRSPRQKRAAWYQLLRIRQALDALSG